ncbi:MAG: hypothetical protein RJA70_27 [Pseudomonadota bacterium]
MAGLGKVRPHSGGRVTVKLTGKDEHRVTYELSCLVAEASHQGTAVVELATGVVSVDCEAAPDWISAFAQVLLRGAWRTRESTPWPRRLTRWRAAPQD